MQQSTLTAFHGDPAIKEKYLKRDAGNAHQAVEDVYLNAKLSASEVLYPNKDVLPLHYDNR